MQQRTPAFFPGGPILHILEPYRLSMAFRLVTLHVCVEAVLCKQQEEVWEARSSTQPVCPTEKRTIETVQPARRPHTLRE
jgi:hypothetical protein